MCFHLGYSFPTPSGLLGQVTLDSDQTLLGFLDAASSDHGMSFNSSVIRRALKQLMYDDLKLCEFTAMTTTTYTIIKDRFIQDVEEPDVTSDTFYMMTCAQVLGKLVKSLQSKVRSKEILSLKTQR